MSPNDIFGSSSANTGTVSFEELENAFNTPTQRQADYERPASPELSDLPQSLTNPNGENLQGSESESIEEVSPEKAMRTGERIARVIDAGIDFTLSNFVAHNNETYRADEKDLQDIAECWGEISQEHGWSLGPEWSLAILYIMVYGPLVKQAFTDRRIMELEERQRQIEERQRQVEEILAEEKKKKPQEPKPDGTAEHKPIVTPFTHQPAEE